MTRRSTALLSRARTPFRAAVIALLTAALAVPQLAVPTVAGAAEGDPISAKVVFQTASGTIPAGYTRDSGAAYSAAAKSGWVTQASLANTTHDPLNVSNNARTRSTCSGVGANQAGVVHMQAPANGSTSTSNVTTPAAWEYDVPNGTYQVSVGIGDASYGGDAEFHTIHVEGVTAFNRYPRKTGTGAPAANSCTATGLNTTTVWTTVSDGKLTIDAVGGQNTKIDYVTIDSVPISGLTATPGATSIALDWADLAGATGYRVWRSNTLPVAMTGNPATTTASEYTDTTALVKGQVYYYAVAPATGTTASVVGTMIDDAAPVEPSTWPVKVNFEGGANSSGGVKGTITTPAGWTSDSGMNYANVRGFGWTDATGTPLDLTKNGRFRANEDAYSPTLTSTMHMQGNTVNAFSGTQVQGTWQLKVPNGSYDIGLGVGDADPGADPTSHTVNVEGVNVINAFVPGTGAARFKEATKTVVVSDGYLTVDAIGGVNTKIDYITVNPTPADPAPAKPTGLTATAGTGSVVLSWTANPAPDTDIKGYNVYRATTATVPTTTPLNAEPITGTTFNDETVVNGTSYYYVVVAVDNADQTSPASAVVGPVIPQPTDPALAPLPLKINFSIPTAPAAPGYTKDTGLPFTNAEGRGWVEPGTHNPRNLSDNARYRDAFSGTTAVTPQQRGLVHMESADNATFNGTKTTGSYEVAVADGEYDVTVSAGDQPGSATASCVAPCYDSLHTIKVEGRTAVDAFQATATKEFAEKTVTHVKVTDGRLTIDAGGADSTNTKINYLEIAESDVTAPGVPANVEATAGDGKVDLTWDCRHRR